MKIVGPADLDKRAQLLGLLEIDHFYMQDGAIICEINQRNIAELKKTPYSYQIVVDDVAKNLEIQNKAYYQSLNKPGASDQSRAAVSQTGKTVNSIIATPSSFVVQGTFGGYYSFAQMTAAMDALVAAYPTLVQKTSLGKSIQNRDIWCLKISDNVSIDEVNEPEVLYTGLQHCREAIGGSSLLFFAQYLAEFYATDQKVKDLVDNREFYIIPCTNPDGWEYNRSTNPNGGGGHRKNMRNNDPGNPGVDMNRNYGIDWGNCAGASASCGSNVTSSDTYWGTAAFSEPETQAIRALVQSHHFVAAIDQHAFGPYYSLPFGRPTLHTMSALDKKFYTWVPAAMGTYNGMRAGNSPESVGYEVAGGIKDWLLMGDIGTGTKGKIYGMTGEGGAGGGTGGTYGSFWAPAGQIVNLCKGMTYQNLQLAYAAGSYVDLQDQDDVILNTTTGSFNLNMTRVVLEDRPVTVSVVPIENVLSVGAPVTVNSLPNYYDTYTGNISFNLFPAIGNGQRIRYAWKVQTGGYTYYDTVTRIYNPVVVFTDNMEGATVATNWTCTGGWNYTNDMAFAGSKSLAESPAANYAASSTRLATYTGTFNLVGATASYLSFWTRYRAENFCDKLQVQVSTNGTTWVPISGSTTIQEAGTLDGSTINGQPSLTGIREDWTKEFFDISAYNGTPALRLRFQFTSDANTSGFAYQVDQGFNIDNVTVVKTNAILMNLPVNFIDFKARMINTNNVQLSWEIGTNQNLDRFEIERSIDGTNFKSLGSVTANQPFSFVDYAPQIGNNYYRIKQIDKDGQFLYSKVVNLEFNPDKVGVIVRPNPVIDQLHIQLTGHNNQPVTVHITDIQGRTIYNKIYKSGNLSDLTIDAGGWKKQMYILKVYRNNSDIMAVERFVKQ